MKTKIKRSFLALVIIASMLIGNTVVFAADSTSNTSDTSPTTTETFYEYDYIVDVRNKAKSNDLSTYSGEDKENIDYILSNAPEEELLYRATLSDAVLKNYYGYSDNQVALLREYNGQPLEEYPDARPLLGSLTGSLSRISGANNNLHIGVIYSWQWTTLPAMRKDDITAISWSGVYQNGASNQIRFNSSKSYSNVSYKVSDTSGNVDSYTLKYTSFTSNNYYNGAGVKFPVTHKKTSTSYQHTAYKGTMYVYGDVVNTNYPLIEASTHAEYGHATGSTSIGVSFPLGINISFSGGVDILGSSNLII